MSALLTTLASRHAIPTVDASSIDAFLDDPEGPGHALLFFTGDPGERSDSGDVAVVLPELVAAFAGRLRAAVIARSAEAELRPRFGVEVMPSLVVSRGRDVIDVLPRIRDWSEYTSRLAAALDPAAPIRDVAANRRVEITHGSREGRA